MQECNMKTKLSTIIVLPFIQLSLINSPLHTYILNSAYTPTNKHGNTLYKSKNTNSTHTHAIWKRLLWQFAIVPCWHFCLLCRPPNYNYRWRHFSYYLRVTYAWRHQQWLRNTDTETFLCWRFTSCSSFLSFTLTGMSRIAQTVFFFFFLENVPPAFCNLNTKLLCWHFFALYFSLDACV